MLAEMLLLTHWEAGWQIKTINSDIEEGWDAWTKNTRQIFYYDDFLTVDGQSATHHLPPTHSPPEPELDGQADVAPLLGPTVR
jgi:hypothetical protein